MVDFPVCPSSERTMSVLPPFCRGIVKIGRFYRKVVSISLFAETLPKLKNCTAQSLSRFATAPFTQGSPWRVPLSTRTPLGKQFNKFPICLFAGSSRYAKNAIFPCKGRAAPPAWPEYGVRRLLSTGLVSFFIISGAL